MIKYLHIQANGVIRYIGPVMYYEMNFYGDTCVFNWSSASDGSDEPDGRSKWPQSIVVTAGSNIILHSDIIKPEPTRRGYYLAHGKVTYGKLQSHYSA